MFECTSEHISFAIECISERSPQTSHPARVFRAEYKPVQARLLYRVLQPFESSIIGSKVAHSFNRFKTASLSQGLNANHVPTTGLSQNCVKHQVAILCRFSRLNASFTLLYRSEGNFTQQYGQGRKRTRLITSCDCLH